MEKNYVSRLAEVIERDPRTPNRISTDADLGRNYVRSILEDGKTPRFDQLLQLLNQLGEQEKTYVLIGQTVTPEDLEFIKVLSKLSPEARKNALQMFRSLADQE